MAKRRATRNHGNAHPIEYHELVISLRDELRAKRKITGVEYVGGDLKGTKADHSGCANLFVVRDSSFTAKPTEQYPEQYVELWIKGATLMPLEVLDVFKGDLQRVLSRLNVSQNTKIHHSGSALAVHYYPKGWRYSSAVSFSIDIDLCYEVADEFGKYRLYVAKPLRGHPTYWKVATDVVETAKISIIDNGNFIGRWAVRIWKAVKNAEPDLNIFTSCSFEHILYHLKDQHPDMSLWRESNMNWVLHHVIQYLGNAVRAERLDHYFMKSENLLPSLDASTTENILNRLEHLARNPECLVNDV